LRILKTYPNLNAPYGGLIERRGRNLGSSLLKSTFKAENLVRRLSWSISSHFSPNQSWNVNHSLKIARIPKPLLRT